MIFLHFRVIKNKVYHNKTQYSNSRWNKTHFAPTVFYNIGILRCCHVTSSNRMSCMQNNTLRKVSETLRIIRHTWNEMCSQAHHFKDQQYPTQWIKLVLHTAHKVQWSPKALGHYQYLHTIALHRKYKSKGYLKKRREKTYSRDWLYSIQFGQDSPSSCLWSFDLFVDDLKSRLFCRWALGNLPPEHLEKH